MFANVLELEEANVLWRSNLTTKRFAGQSPDSVGFCDGNLDG